MSKLGRSFATLGAAQAGAWVSQQDAENLRRLAEQLKDEQDSPEASPL